MWSRAIGPGFRTLGWVPRLTCQPEVTGWSSAKDQMLALPSSIVEALSACLHGYHMLFWGHFCFFDASWLGLLVQHRTISRIIHGPYTWQYPTSGGSRVNLAYTARSVFILVSQTYCALWGVAAHIVASA